MVTVLTLASFGALLASPPEHFIPPPPVAPPLIEAHSQVWDEGFRKMDEVGCRDGDQSFCFDLAKMLKAGIGGPADTLRAEKLFAGACRAGYAAACKEVER